MASVESLFDTSTSCAISENIIQSSNWECIRRRKLLNKRLEINYYKQLMSCHTFHFIFLVIFQKEKFIEKKARHAVLARSKTNILSSEVQKMLLVKPWEVLLFTSRSQKSCALLCRSWLNKVSDLIQLPWPGCALSCRAKLYNLSLQPTTAYWSWWTSCAAEVWIK